METTNQAVAEPKQSTEQERTTIRLAGEAMQQVREHAEELNISVNEFIRRAIGTEMYLIDQARAGGEVLVKKDGVVRQIVMLR